jgi:integrase/recombinase XerD
MAPSIQWPHVRALWKSSGRTVATVEVYSTWARRFVDYCARCGLDPVAHLTEEFAEKFRREGCPPRQFKRRRRRLPVGRIAVVAVRALSCALAGLGLAVPEWRRAPPRPQPSKLVGEFVAHRVQHRGVAVATIRHDVFVATQFLSFLRARGRRPAVLRVLDLDKFIVALTSTRAMKTVAGICSTLRAFLRFLHMTGRLRADLAPCVVAPRTRALDRPPRALPWRDVQRILRAIDVRQPPGRRDLALFLMMATYGMGAGEVYELLLDDVDWSARTIRVRRPKTGTVTVLPLLDPVGAALSRYLRLERPAHARDRNVFVSDHMPHGGLAGSTTIRHRLHRYAMAAGVSAPFLGTHVFRHTHATRQIEGGAPPKIVADILGHRRPESTSAYVRGATIRLRAIALPVPK